MDKNQIIELMSKPIRAVDVNLYQEVHIAATGSKFTKCFCGHGWDNFIRVCKQYADKLKQQ